MGQEAGKDVIYKFGRFSFDPRRLKLMNEGEEVDLDTKPAQVLLALVEQAGKLVTKEDLLKKVWGDTAVTDDSLYQPIKVLRRTFGEGPKDNKYIMTISRVGTKFVAPVEVVDRIETAAPIEVVSLVEQGQELQLEEDKRINVNPTARHSAPFDVEREGPEIDEGRRPDGDFKTYDGGHDNHGDDGCYDANDYLYDERNDDECDNNSDDGGGLFTFHKLNKDRLNVPPGLIPRISHSRRLSVCSLLHGGQTQETSTKCGARPAKNTVHSRYSWLSSTFSIPTRT